MSLRLAIILAAIFWTTLWGPIGLVAVHAPDGVSSGDGALYTAAALPGGYARLASRRSSAGEHFYQRMLAGDSEEGEDIAREQLKERAAAQPCTQEVTLPALRLAERDRERKVLSGRAAGGGHGELSAGRRCLVARPRERPTLRCRRLGPTAVSGTCQTPGQSPAVPADIRVDSATRCCALQGWTGLRPSGGRDSGTAARRPAASATRVAAGGCASAPRALPAWTSRAGRADLLGRTLSQVGQSCMRARRAGACGVRRRAAQDHGGAPCTAQAVDPANGAVSSTPALPC